MDYTFVRQVTVAAANAGVDFGSQHKVPRGFVHTGGGVLTFLDGLGTSRVMNVDAGRPYPIDIGIAKITACTGEGYVQLFEDPSNLPGPASPLSPVGARWVKDAVDGSAGATLTALPFHVVNGGRKVTRVRFIPAASLTANDTNYATITVAAINALGISLGTVAEVTTETTASGGTDNWTAGVAVEFPVDTDEDDLPDGTVLRVAIAKAASGVAVPAGLLQVD